MCRYTGAPIDIRARAEKKRGGILTSDYVFTDLSSPWREIGGPTTLDKAYVNPAHEKPNPDEWRLDENYKPVRKAARPPPVVESSAAASSSAQPASPAVVMDTTSDRTAPAPAPDVSCAFPTARAPTPMFWFPSTDPQVLARREYYNL